METITYVRNMSEEVYPQLKRSLTREGHPHTDLLNCTGNGVGAQVEKTIVLGFFWLTFIILFLAFNPARLNIWQITSAFLATGIIALGAIAVTWINFKGE